MLKFSLKLSTLLLCILTLTLSNFAQTSKGFITGNVADQNGAAVPGANIVITNVSTGTKRETVSQGNGSYRLDAVDPGTYNLEITASGFANSTSNNIVVAASQTAEVNLQLSVSGATGTVDVVGTDSNVQLQTSNGERSNTFEVRQITELPIANLNPTSLVFTLPGVADVGQTLAGGFVQGTEFSVNGLRARANNQLLDGLDNNDNSINGQSYQPSVRDGYAEVAILSSNYSAEFGRAGGAITNVTTRSGTNRFHGSAYDIIQNSAFNSLTPGQRRDGLTQVPQSADNTFGGSLGGPIFKNKLFFFGTFQADRVRSNSSASAAVPTAAGFNTLRTLFPAGTSTNLDYYLGIVGSNRGVTSPFNVAIRDTTTGAIINNVQFGTVLTVAPQPVNTYDYITRVDYTPTSRDSFTGRYVYNNQNFTNQFPTVFQGFEVDVPSITRNFLASYTRNFSPNVTNEFRFGYGFVDANFTPRTSAAGAFGPSISFSGTGLGSGVNGVGLNSGFPQGRTFSNYQFQDTVTYTVGKNTFRIGTDTNVQRAQQSVPFNSRGTVSFTASNSITPAGGGAGFVINGFQNFIQGFSGNNGQENRVFGSPIVFPNSLFQNYFINDELKVRENLTLNLGLRYENYGTPFNEVAFPSFAGFNAPISTVVRQKRDNNNFGPRFSFAYSPDFADGFTNRIFGDKETVIRGGFAIGYDVFFNNILGNTGASSPNVASSLRLGRTATTGANPRGFNDFRVNNLPTSATLNPLSSITSIETNLQNPESYVYNLGIQRRFFQSYILDLAYVGSRGLKLFINDQLNPFVGASRRFASRGSVLLRTNGGDSNYNSFQARFERGFKNGFLLRSTYTFSKAIDNVNSEVFATSGGTSTGSNFANRAIDRSVATFDVPHIFTFTSLFDVPTFGAQGIFRKIVNGFTVGAIFRAQSGAVETAYIGGIDLNGDGSAFNDRPAYGNPNAPANSVAFSNEINGTNSPTGFSDLNGNPIAFNAARYIVDFNNRTALVARNSLRGPIFRRLDMSIQRDFGLKFTGVENLRFQFRAEVFNVLNIPNFSPGTGDVTSDQFNDPFTQGQGSARSARIQLRFVF